MVIITLVLVAVLILLPGLFFVSLVWTHRPDLGLLIILRDAIQEIKNTFIAEKKSLSGKEKEI